MKNQFIKTLQQILNQCVEDLDSAKSLFLTAPEKDFSRNRKISFQDAVNAVMQFSGKSLQNEVLDYFGHTSVTPSSSAFIQQRDKILPAAFQFLFHLFLEKAAPYCQRTYDGFFLIACDGSDVNVSRNPDDEETFIKEGERGYNQLHLNALFDLLNQHYCDAVTQGKKKLHERQAFNTMVDRYPQNRPTIFIADRGYESFNTFAHVIEAGQFFVIRMKDPDSNGILSSYKLPEGPFDLYITTTLTKRHTKETLGNPDVYTILSPKTCFDYFPNKYATYDIRFRIVGFEVADGVFEAVATNLSEDDFPLEKIRDIYMRRWGEENSFRELKHTIGLSTLHSKKKNLVLQEILARMIFYNFCEIVTMHAVVDNDKGRKWNYRINFATAVNICRTYLRNGGDAADIMLTIQRYITPIRDGRSYRRNLRQQRFENFMYRLA